MYVVHGDRGSRSKQAAILSPFERLARFSRVDIFEPLQHRRYYIVLRSTRYQVSYQVKESGNIGLVFAINFFQAQIHSRNPPEGTKLNELEKKKNGPQLPRLVNDLDRTLLQFHSRSSSPYDWSTRSELYPEAETAQPGQRATTRMHTHRKSTHTLGNGDTTQQPARDSDGKLAAAAAALLLLCCCCFTTRDASRSTTRHNRLFLVLCFLERTQERVTAQRQQQQKQQQQRQQQ